MALSQGLYQKQLQKLSPQQIQLMKLLQVPTENLEARIKEELEENPALEQNDEDDFKEEFTEIDEFTAGDDDTELDGSQDDYDNIDISDYVQDGDDETPDYKMKDTNYPEEDETRTSTQRVEVGFNEVMLEQLGLLNLDDGDQIIAEQILGNLEEDGYLRRELISIVDDLAFRQNIQTTERKVEELLLLIQEFEPAGIAARNLQECLQIQLKRNIQRGVAVQFATKILDKYFDEFTKKHYDKIQRSLNITDEQLKECIQVITKLNPKPGGNIGASNKSENYVIPDFFVFNNNGVLELSLNSKNAPDLRISGDYREMLRDYEKGSKKDKRQKEAVLFIKQKLDSAKWFIDAIKQRHHTLTSTMQAILNLQKAFFLSGDETTLRPMILKDIAEKTELDISTVSRVANSKFVQTEFGTFKLKYFFSESLQTESGEEVSTREVKKILTNFIEAEDKRNPLSDDRLTELLNEKGYNIARRTVAKYREQLNIAVARLRKEL